MTVRTISTLAVVVGLSLTNSVFSKDPARPATPPAASKNQVLADMVARALGSSGVAVGAHVKVTTQQGVVDLSGTVVSVKQAKAMVDQALMVAGVDRVEITNLKLVTAIESQSITAAQGFEPAGPLTLPPVGPMGSPPPPGVGFGMVEPRVVPSDPIPLAGPQMPSYDMTGPKMPPNAWPTYAPYPNMSRVAYPQSYPYNAFPFIGPFYPFPKVPLGWRSVKLEWEDGYWYIGRISTPHDYWKVRFW